MNLLDQLVADIVFCFAYYFRMQTRLKPIPLHLTVEKRANLRISFNHGSLIVHYRQYIFHRVNCSVRTFCDYDTETSYYTFCTDKMWPLLRCEYNWTKYEILYEILHKSKRCWWKFQYKSSLKVDWPRIWTVDINRTIRFKTLLYNSIIFWRNQETIPDQSNCVRRPVYRYEYPGSLQKK